MSIESLREQLFLTAEIEAERFLAILRLTAVLVLALALGAALLAVDGPPPAAQRQIVVAGSVMAVYAGIGLISYLTARPGRFRRWMPWLFTTADCALVLFNVATTVLNIGAPPATVWVFPAIWLAPLVLVFGSAALWLSVAKIQSQHEWGVNALPTSLLWVATGVMAAALLIRSSGVRRFGAYLGARTLPIFVLQFPILVLAREFLAITGPSPLASPFVQVLFPLLTTAATVAVALAIHRLCQKPALSWLFRAPDQLLEPGSLTAPTLRKEPAVVQVPAR